jgi:TRAP-type C4-dicarboxylate transport system permease small subunit
MAHLFQSLSDTVNKIVEVIGSLLMGILIIVIASEVFARYVMNSSLSWSEECGRIIFLWAIFLGTSIGFKRGTHMGLHFITEKVPQQFKKGISVISLSCTAIFFLFVLIEGISVTLRMTTQLTPAMEISFAWQLSAIPAGALLTLLHIPALIVQSEEAGDSHGLDPSM